jgi:hypothetical protein
MHHPIPLVFTDSLCYPERSSLPLVTSIDVAQEVVFSDDGVAFATSTGEPTQRTYKHGQLHVNRKSQLQQGLANGENGPKRQPHAVYNEEWGQKQLSS